MSTKKKDKLLINLLEGERYKHRVAMVTDEGAFNQHEPNSNMARMFDEIKGRPVCLISRSIGMNNSPENQL